MITHHLMQRRMLSHGQNSHKGHHPSTSAVFFGLFSDSLTGRNRGRSDERCSWDSTCNSDPADVTPVTLLSEEIVTSPCTYSIRHGSSQCPRGPDRLEPSASMSSFLKTTVCGGRGRGRACRACKSVKTVDSTRSDSARHRSPVRRLPVRTFPRRNSSETTLRIHRLSMAIGCHIGHYTDDDSSNDRWPSKTKTRCVPPRNVSIGAPAISKRNDRSADDLETYRSEDGVVKRIHRSNRTK